MQTPRRRRDVRTDRSSPRTTGSHAARGLLAALLLAGAAVVPLPEPGSSAGTLAVSSAPHDLSRLALALYGALPLVLVAARTREWSRGLVMRSMGLGLRRLLVYTAVLALGVGGTAAWLVAAAILAGFGVSWALRKVFPPS